MMFDWNDQDQVLFSISVLLLSPTLGSIFDKLTFFLINSTVYFILFLFLGSLIIYFFWEVFISFFLKFPDLVIQTYCRLLEARQFLYLRLELGR
jgi:hypothetical protein